MRLAPLASHVLWAPFTIAVTAHSSAALAEASPAEVVKLACARSDPTTDHSIATTDLAEAILIQSGYPLSNLITLARSQNPDRYRETVISMIVSKAGLAPTLAEAVSENALAVGQEIADPNSELGLSIAPGSAAQSPSSDRFWYLRAPAATNFTCKAGEAPKTIVEIVRAPTSIPALGIVKTPDDLSQSKDRASVDSATVGLDVTRTKNDDGTMKRTSTISVDGTVGVRLTNQLTPTFLYANYTLSRTRTHPAPPLDPGAHRDDNDTNGLAIGFLFGDVAPNPVVSITGTLAYVADFVKDSGRGVAGIVLHPGFRVTSFPVCGFGYLKPISGPHSFRTKCVVEGELDYSHVFKKGSADFADRGNFLALGGAIGFDIAPPLHAKSGVVGSFRYRFLPTIAGHAPDVHRWDASLKYRWWVGNGLGIDLGGTFKRGEELKTYTNENEFALAFGLVM